MSLSCLSCGLLGCPRLGIVWGFRDPQLGRPSMVGKIIRNRVLQVDAPERETRKCGSDHSMAAKLRSLHENPSTQGLLNLPSHIQGLSASRP